MRGIFSKSQFRFARKNLRYRSRKLFWKSVSVFCPKTCGRGVRTFFWKSFGKYVVFRLRKLRYRVEGKFFQKSCRFSVAKVAVRNCRRNPRRIGWQNGFQMWVKWAEFFWKLLKKLPFPLGISEGVHKMAFKHGVSEGAIYGFQHSNRISGDFSKTPTKTPPPSPNKWEKNFLKTPSISSLPTGNK